MIEKVKAWLRAQGEDSGEATQYLGIRVCGGGEEGGRPRPWLAQASRIVVEEEGERRNQAKLPHPQHPLGVGG